MADVPHRSSWFFVVDSGPRSRRPIDVILLATGLVVAAVCARAAGDRRVSPLPSWGDTLADATYLLTSAYVVVVVVVVLLKGPRHLRLAINVLSAAGLAVAGTVLVWVVLDDALVLRVAVGTAVLLVLRPWVVLTFRRVHALIVAVLCLAAWASGHAEPVEVVGALALGTAAAGAVLVVLGSPGGHPDLGQVGGSLRALGVPVEELRFAEGQPWGARVLYGWTPGGPVQVKVYGRDATDAHRAARWWRSLVYRDQAAPGATRLQLVEHEALVTILADRAGVAVSPVVAAASSQGDAVLVLGAPPAALADDDLDDATLRRLWAEVALLHHAGLCHGELTLQNIGVGPVLSGFGNGTLAAPAARRAQEVATLLTAVAVRVGAERAVESAVAGLGTGDVAAAQPYLQKPALPASLRSTSGLKTTLAAVRDEITVRTGVSPQPPAGIARVKGRDLLQTALLLLAAYALFTTLVQLDWATVLDSWADADWRWIVLGLVIAQATSAADAVSTMSMVSERLPLRPLMMLQYAIKFVGLAISATMGRIALNTSFLSRFGVGATVAVTASALDSFAGAVVNVVVVLVALPFLDNLPNVQLGGSDDVWRIVALLAVVLVLSIVAMLLLPRLRARVVLLVGNARSAVRVVTDSPARGLLLLGSNFVSLLITAVALACMVEGINPSLSFGVVLAVTAGAALFASIVPVPGNVGVGEAALTAGLVAAGIPSSPAFAIAVTQRISTSYLPPVFGAWAVRWLRKADYIS